MPNSRHFAVTLLLAFALPSAACDGGESAGEPRRVAEPGAEAPSAVTAPAKMSPTQPPNVVQQRDLVATVDYAKLTKVQTIHDAAADLQQRRPELFNTVMSLSPTSSRTGALRFSGTDHHDPDASVLFAKRLLDASPEQVELRLALADVIRRTGAPHARLSTTLLAAESSPEVRGTLVHNLATVDPELANEGLLLGARDSVAGVREAAYRAAAHQRSISDDLRSALLAGLEEADLSARRTAVRSLGVLQVPEALDGVVDQVSSPDPQLRLLALRAVRRIDASRLSALDLEQLAQDPDRRVAAEASRAMTSMRNAER